MTRWMTGATYPPMKEPPTEGEDRLAHDQPLNNEKNRRRQVGHESHRCRDGESLMNRHQRAEQAECEEWDTSDCTEVSRVRGDDPHSSLGRKPHNGNVRSVLSRRIIGLARTYAVLPRTSQGTTDSKTFESRCKSNCAPTTPPMAEKRSSHTNFSSICFSLF